jgi:hypothetical protein
VSNLQKMGGVAALLEATIYVSAFVFFGAFWDFPVQAGMDQQLAFLKENQVTLAIVNLSIYVVFGILLAVLVLAIHERLQDSAKTLSQIASVFGLIWVGLVIASGMIANIGLSTVIELSVNEPEQARSVWLAVDAVAEGIGGGNEIVGGLWVLLLSIAALKSNAFSKKLNYLGMFVGLAGISTVYPEETLTEIFGLSQILWFLWVGLALICETSKQTKNLQESYT